MPDEPKELTEIKEQDVEAVSERLKEWITTLPEQEQMVLGWILTRAASADAEAAQRYADQVGGGVRVSALMAEAAGLKEVTGFQRSRAMPDKVGPVTVWTYRW
jgi:hypothetical protein